MLRADSRLHLEKVFALVDSQPAARAYRKGIQRVDVATIQAYVRRTRLTPDFGSEVDQFGRGHERPAQVAPPLGVASDFRLRHLGVTTRYGQLTGRRKQNGDTKAISPTMHADDFAGILPITGACERTIGRRDSQPHAAVIVVEFGKKIQCVARCVQGRPNFFEIPVAKLQRAYAQLKRDADPSLPPALLCRDGGGLRGFDFSRSKSFRHRNPPAVRVSTAYNRHFLRKYPRFP